MSGIVNLSNHNLTNLEISVLSKGLGLCLTPGEPDIGNIIQDLDVFKRRTRLQIFFSEFNQDLPRIDTQSEGSFEHKSFKLKTILQSSRAFSTWIHVLFDRTGLT